MTIKTNVNVLEKKSKFGENLLQTSRVNLLNYIKKWEAVQKKMNNVKPKV